MQQDLGPTGHARWGACGAQPGDTAADHRWWCRRRLGVLPHRGCACRLRRRGSLESSASADTAARAARAGTTDGTPRPMLLIAASDVDTSDWPRHTHGMGTHPAAGQQRVLGLPRRCARCATASGGAPDANWRPRSRWSEPGDRSSEGTPRSMVIGSFPRLERPEVMKEAPWTARRALAAVVASALLVTLAATSLYLFQGTR